MRYFCILLLLAGVALLAPARAAETDAVAISKNIRARHLPYGTIIDPVFAARDSDEIISYTRGGDSAIWTGHYLAAESFRYAVTHDPEALDNVRAALGGIRLLISITGTDLLARCAVPADSPYAAAISQEESHNGMYSGVYEGQQYVWIGHTSRDQYSGVFFGLDAAYEYVPEVRNDAKELVTRALDFLRHNNWAVTMPDGGLSTVFWGRADQQLAFLQIGRKVNSDRFSSAYRAQSLSTAAAMLVPITLEVTDQHNSYFKFNLDTINLYSLLHASDNFLLKAIYEKTYDILRNTTDDHGNAFFNMIDRALNGANAQRDAATRQYLDQWLQRSRRDEYVDLRGVYESCGQEDRACNPIPVDQRVHTDFLWQRSPFLLYGGGDGRIEGAGIDYILPYWMARYYGVL